MISKRIIALYVISICLFVVSAVHMIKIIASELQLYITESECVAQYTKLGIPRSDIETADGTCWVKEEEQELLNTPVK
tara:strand:- start:8461 stop:8694 length:234 start_codon:yes stop_codon:yes gene_type:complete